MMISVHIYPAGIREVKYAIDLFGTERLEVNTWPMPVYIHNLTEDEYMFCVEFFAEIGVSVERLN